MSAIKMENNVEAVVSFTINMDKVSRAEIWFADLSLAIGAEQSGQRPVLVLQNDVGNKFSPTVIVAAITSQTSKAKLPTHVELDAKKYGLDRDSVVMLEQFRTIDKARLLYKLTSLDEEIMKKVDRATAISLGLVDYFD